MTAGDLVFCSGTAGIHRSTGTARGAPAAQTEQALVNLAAVQVVSGFRGA
jgi:enamine deaminase RidA (YjgF/YER057c/UK114 family)